MPEGGPLKPHQEARGTPGRWTKSQALRLALPPGGRISITFCLCVANEEYQACGPGEEGHGDLGRGGGGYPAEGLGGMAAGALRLNVTGVSPLAGGISANGGAGTGEGRGGKGQGGGQSRSADFNRLGAA